MEFLAEVAVACLSDADIRPESACPGAHLSSSPPTLATDKAVNLREVELGRQAVHYRSSSPRLPKATSTPTAGSAPGANSALTIKYQDTEQSKSRGQTIKNLRS